MREIKFRAWDKEKMIYDISLKNIAENFDGGYSLESKNVGLPSTYEWDNVVFMQYTGLKDKNGKEIYEGDIIEEYFSDSEDDNYLYSGIVIYFNTEFCLKIKNDTYIKLVNTGNNLEIIGNIYENKELLDK